jgi:hypothetical protein
MIDGMRSTLKLAPEYDVLGLAQALLLSKGETRSCSSWLMLTTAFEDDEAHLQGDNDDAGKLPDSSLHLWSEGDGLRASVP